MIFVVTRDPKAPLRVVQFLNRKYDTGIATLRVDMMLYEVEVQRERQPHEIEALMAKLVSRQDAHA